MLFGSKCYATVLNKPKGDHIIKAVRDIFAVYQDQQSVGRRIYTPDNNEYLNTTHAQLKNNKYIKYLPGGATSKWFYHRTISNLISPQLINGIALFFVYIFFFVFEIVPQLFGSFC